LKDSMPEAARMGDQVKHSSAMLGLIAGVIIGAAIAVAVVGTGGAALAIGAAVCTGVSMGGGLGKMIGKHIPGFDSGPILIGVPVVMIGGMMASVVGGIVGCTGPPLLGPHPGSMIAQGSSNVFIGSMPAARKGDKASCGASIGYGCDSVLIGGEQVTYIEIQSEIPAWIDWGLTALGLVGGYGLFRAAGFSLVATLARLGGATAGSFAGGWGGGKLAEALGFEGDSWGNDLMSLAGAIGGGWLGFKGGARLGRGKVVPNKLAPHEIEQATEITNKFGGKFVGQPKRDTPGIDGFRDGKPVSLKQYEGNKPMAVLKHVSKAETQLKNAGFSNGDVFVDAKGVDSKTMIDFANKGPLKDIPNQGTVDNIFIRTSDGWVKIGKNGAQKILLP